jgi:hypothetical protein
VENSDSLKYLNGSTITALRYRRASSLWPYLRPCARPISPPPAAVPQPPAQFHDSFKAPCLFLMKHRCSRSERFAAQKSRLWVCNSRCWT